MKHLKLALILAVVVCLWQLPVAAQAPAQYVKEIDAWHAERVAELKAPDGWLNLVGLYWLQEGRSSFGSASDNTIVFPFGTIAPSEGYFQRTGDSVAMFITGVGDVTVNGKPAKAAIVYSKDSARQPIVAIGSLQFSIIKRADKLGIRLRDFNSPLLRKFTDIDRYPVDTEWRISAVLQKPEAPKRIAITNVIGQTSQQKSPGELIFNYHNRQYSFETLEDDGQLFIVFADGTSGKTTYQSGRFLLVPKPSGPGNTTVIDFNKAYNPPCAFTTFATCPLPPKENVLPIDVEAGEKNFGHSF